MEVFAYRDQNATYPEAAPFHPQELYPEAPFAEVAAAPNGAYAAVRSLLALSGWDQANFGNADWNPLRQLVRPGDRVLLKPNLIKEAHPRHPDGWKWMLTHGAIIRAVADYVAKALNGRGEIIVADAPQTDSSFAAVVRVLQLDQLADFYRSKGVTFRLIDLRKFEWDAVDDVVVARRNLTGDPFGYFTVDLGADSLFCGHRGEGKYYGADYDTAAINAHHRGRLHEYVIAGSAITCDVFINLPKMKTHKKTGVTLSLKNLVGINGDKNYLPHYTEGTPETGGDQFPLLSARSELERRGLRRIRNLALRFPGVGPWLYRKLKRVGTGVLGSTGEVIRSGNWHGNDTCWRMCLDLNRVLLHTDKAGLLSDQAADERRRYLTIIDGLIAGDGDGPVDVDAVAAGLLVMGTNPAAADAAAARLMGFDPGRLPMIREAFKPGRFALAEGDWEDVNLRSNVAAWSRRLAESDPADTLHFRPHFGWRGQIELPAMLTDELIEDGQRR